MTREEIARALHWDGRFHASDLLDRIEAIVRTAVEAERARRRTLKERVLDTLAAHPEGLTTVEVRRLTGGGYSARDTVYRMHKAGILERTQAPAGETGGVQYRFRLRGGA